MIKIGLNFLVKFLLFLLLIRFEFEWTVPFIFREMLDILFG